MEDREDINPIIKNYNVPKYFAEDDFFKIVRINMLNHISLCFKTRTNHKSPIK